MATHLSSSFVFATVFTCAFVLGALAARDLADDKAMVARHEQWMAKYGRVYNDAAEKARRLEVFKANIAFIESINAGNNKFWLEANQFADLTDDEFRATRTGYKLPASKGQRTTAFRYANVSLDELPDSVDWRAKGAVTPIKDQGECGCCWELVDCDVNGMDQGCNGGEMDDAFQFIVDNGGLTTESNYPYTAADGTCNSGKASNDAASIKGYEDVPANDESSLRKAVANQPVSVAVDGGDSHFRFYKGGVLSGACGTELDHGIAAVGYAVAADGTKYWLMKNSWGTSWGEGALEEKDASAPVGKPPSAPVSQPVLIFRC
ncbi:unnamed protein product [Urochloa decumbens]|uniref:Uncharacterized protein n=1 Tax=Urochloa decumbens TaxID=240449 RepID=A0ABC9CDW9_9POAL